METTLSVKSSDVFQVMKKYQLSAPSMDQLQTCYFQVFGEQLPLKQYMSLYDNWEAGAKKLPTQSEPATDPKTVALRTTAGTLT